MNFDFEQSYEKGILFFYGVLDDASFDEMNRVLLNALNQCDNLLVYLHGVKKISARCHRLLKKIRGNPGEKNITIIGGGFGKKILQNNTNRDSVILNRMFDNIKS